MASVYPAMKGRLGSTDYYIITMKANDVANQLTIPKELPEWEDMGLGARYQRDVNYNRVSKPYRSIPRMMKIDFFGALIVDVMNSENLALSQFQRSVALSPDYTRVPARVWAF